MKALVFVLFGVGLAAVHADNNLLQNGDFSSGLAHWYGNIQALADVPEAGVSNNNGGVVKLKSSDWTKVTQDFEVKPGVYKLHVTFMVSPDTQFSTQITDYMNVPAKIGFSNEHPSDARVRQWVIAVADSDALSSIFWRVNTAKNPGPQSYTFTIRGINFSNRQTLILAFPPGTGFITLTQVSLDAP